MAIKATVYKVKLEVSDLDRSYYQSHGLTVALHPSETQVRMLARLMVFALNASERLQFTKGISTDEEPDLWAKADTGDVELWIELGQPSEKRIKKACQNAQHVKIYTFQNNSADTWFQTTEKKLQRYRNLEVIHLEEASVRSLVQHMSRNFELQCTVQDGSAWFSCAEASTEITPVVRMRAAGNKY